MPENALGEWWDQGTASSHRDAGAKTKNGGLGPGEKSDKLADTTMKRAVASSTNEAFRVCTHSLHGGVVSIWPFFGVLAIFIRTFWWMVYRHSVKKYSAFLADGGNQFRNVKRVKEKKCMTNTNANVQTAVESLK